MSVSSTHQTLDKTEPFRGVQHAKPPIKPKPIVPPRPKEISCPSPNSEIKNALLSPTCGPCSPTSDIPSALKISQLTGPQPYGTRRPSLRRWSSSVGEEVNQEINVLSPVENTASDLSTKSITQPLSASLKPLQTGTVWKGKSPFMLTTRGWGEQRWNQGKDSRESESASQKHSSSLASKRTDLETRETTTLKENLVSTSTSYGGSSSDLGHRRVVVQDLKSSPKEPSSISVDVVLSPSKDLVSAQLGSSGILKSLDKPAQFNEIKKSHEISSMNVNQSSISTQSDLNLGVCKQSSQYNHKQDIRVNESDQEVAHVPTVKSLHKQNVLIESEDFKNEQIPNPCKTEVPTTSYAGSTLEQIPVPNEISLTQVPLENKNTDHQQVTHTASGQPPLITDLTSELYPQYIDAAYKQYSKNHGIFTEQQTNIKDVDPTAKQEEYLTPQTKELQKPSVQFEVPQANVLVGESLREAQQTLTCTLSESGEPTTQEIYRYHEHACDGKTEIRTWIKEEQGDLSSHLQIPQRSSPKAQEETDQKSHVKPEGKENSPDFGGTEVTDNTVTDHVIYREYHHEDNTSTTPTDLTLTYAGERYGLPVEKKYESQAADADYDGSDSEHEEIKVVGLAERDSLCHTERSYGYIVDKHQDINTRIADDILDEHESLYKRQQDHVPHATVEYTQKHIDPTSESRSVCGMNILSSHDSETPSVRLCDLDTIVQPELSEHADIKKAPHLYMESQVQEIDNLLPEEIDTCLRESHTRNSESKELQHGYTETEVLYVIHTQPKEPKEEFTKSENNEPERVQDRDIQLEKLDYRVNESGEQRHTHSQLEEPFHRYIQSEEIAYKYTQPEESIHRYPQSEAQIHTSERSFNQYVQSDDAIHRYKELETNQEQPKEPLIKYAVSDEPIHRYEQPNEPSQQYVQSEELIHTNEDLENSYGQSEELLHRYEQSEKPFKYYVQSEEPIHRSKELESNQEQPKELLNKYVESEEPIHRYEQPDEPCQQYVQSEELIYKNEELETSYKQLEEPLHKYEQSDEPVHQYVQSEEQIYGHEVLESSYESEEPLHRFKQSEEPFHQYVQSDGPIHRSEDLESTCKQSEDPCLKYVQSEQSVGKSKEPICKQANIEEPDYQHAQSEDSISRYAQSANLQLTDKSSQDLQRIQIYSEETQNENIQSKEPKQKKKMSAETEHIVISTEEVQSEPNISMEQHDKPIHTAEAGHIHKYINQQHSYSEEPNYKDALMDEPNLKTKLSVEQNHSQSQSGEPQMLYTHAEEPQYSHSYPEEPQHVDYPSEEPRVADIKLDEMTEKHTESDELESEESRDVQEEGQDNKHTYLKNNINGHTELGESQDSDITSDDPELQLRTVNEIKGQGPEETISQSEEPQVENNFDFLEDTVVLDSSYMRNRASLGKKRCRKTPVPGACTSQEEDAEYWMFRDSTDPKCCPERDSDDEEKEQTSTDHTPDNSPSPGKSPTKKAGIFSGIISPSILKGRLKARSKTTEDETVKPESEEAKSPGKEKDSSSHSLNWLHALKKKKKKQPK
ncbi:182 kDa tankyrase-1-binding protein [Mixophyes fleayi]|uniref:182 kDa tankyrase-1-binding protein n=1 Tax=Mixophyes fleayi TaxID=3061075 RepID=UPI003F4E40B4